MNNDHPFSAQQWVRNYFSSGLTVEHIAKLLEVSRILMRFESIGVNCRFGFVQRFYNCEPISLLRWAGLPIEEVARGIDLAWEGISEYSNINVEYRADLKHFLLIIHKYRLILHTDYEDPGTDLLELKEKNAKRLIFLVRKFCRDIINSEKYYLFFTDSLAEEVDKINTLHSAMLRRNSKNKLLVVHKTKDQSQVGNIYLDYGSEGLINGYVREHDECMENGLIWPDWVSLCNQAHAHWTAR
jgi:hypothetical protein